MFTPLADKRDTLAECLKSSRFPTNLGDSVPLVELYFANGELTDDQKADLSRKITDLLVQEAKVPQHYTWVIIHELPESSWMIDRLTLPELFAKLKAQQK